MRSKNQYKLAFADGYVLTMTMNYGTQQTPTFSKQKYFLFADDVYSPTWEYPSLIPAAISSELDDSGEERIHVANKVVAAPTPVCPVPPPAQWHEVTDVSDIAAVSIDHGYMDGSTIVLSSDDVNYNPYFEVIANRYVRGWRITVDEYVEHGPEFETGGATFNFGGTSISNEDPNTPAIEFIPSPIETSSSVGRVTFYSNATQTVTLDARIMVELLASDIGPGKSVHRGNGVDSFVYVLINAYPEFTWGQNMSLVPHYPPDLDEVQLVYDVDNETYEVHVGDGSPSWSLPSTGEFLVYQDGVECPAFMHVVAEGG